MPRLKALGFDNWTGGAQHFERLVEPLAAEGIDLSLLHLGSWGNDRGRPAEEHLGRLKMRDISWYGGIDFDRILEIEQPDVVLFLSTKHLAHRAFLRLCRQRGVPTIHLYHGLVRVQDVDGQMAYRPHPVSWSLFVLSRVGKSLRHTWPAYSRSLARTSASVAEWGRFLLDIVDGALARHDKKNANDARTSVSLVYTAADIRHAVNMYGHDPSEVIPVGNPDLTTFGLSAHMIGSSVRTPTMALTDVMYIDTALIATGLLFKDDAAFVGHVLALRDSLARQGKRLVFKPHPSMRLRGIDRTLAHHGVESVNNDDFTARLSECCACIAETSTLAMIPALMGMPLLLARFGRLRTLQFGEVLRTYPRARYLDDPDRLTTVLQEEQSTCNPALVKAWIDENAGPLPASDMPKRVAQVVLNLVRSNAGISNAGTMERDSHDLWPTTTPGQSGRSATHPA